MTIPVLPSSPGYADIVDDKEQKLPSYRIMHTFSATGLTLIVGIWEYSYWWMGRVASVNGATGIRKWTATCAKYQSFPKYETTRCIIQPLLVP